MRKTWCVAIALTGLALASTADAQTVSDPNLTVDTIASGLSLPTTMAFVGDDDILVLEKNTGRVRRVRYGVLQPDALVVPVDPASERGLLGIAVNTESPPRVFLFYSETLTPGVGGTAFANRVYRYTWNAATGTLQSPTLILDLPVTPGQNHDGGIILLGPPGEAPGVGDGSLLYTVIGDLNRDNQLENYALGAAPDDTAVVLRTRQDGTAAPGNPFTPYCSVTTTTTCTSNANCPGGEACTLKVARYWAYGVRNSFGMALDPLTGDLWDTENGPSSFDEVNRIVPGMNSGWEAIMGPDSLDPNDTGDLFDIPGEGSTYSDPEFSWQLVVAPTAIVFPAGSSLGPGYDDVALVGNNNYGSIARFPLNPGRTGFALTGALADLVANDNSEASPLVWGINFGAITDLEIGQGGHLYVVGIVAGKIFRIRGPENSIPSLGPLSTLALAAGIAFAAAAVASRRSLSRRRPRPSPSCSG
jgi:glucose/arabinose dehydrogenase